MMRYQRLRPALAIVVALLLPSQSPQVQADPGNTWTKVAEDKTGRREGSVLLAGPASDQMLLLGGTVEGAPYVQAFDTAGQTWNAYSAATPEAPRGVHPYYQTAYDAAGKRLICMDAGQIGINAHSHSRLANVLDGARFLEI